MPTRVLTPFTASDGENLAFYRWQADASSKPPGDLGEPSRGLVLMVHGLGEHAGRYDHVANALSNWGFDVCAYDQRGHGESTGVPGTLPASNALLDDLAAVIDGTRQQYPKLPLILLGHSLGGLVASRFVSLGIRPVDALVLSSPALDAGLGAFQKLLLKVLTPIAPNLCVANGLDASYISHDARVVKDYLSDRLVHNKISPRLGTFIATAGPATVASAARWRTPTLLMYAGADKLVNPAGSRRFAELASESKAVKPGLVTAKCFDGYYHELFNELEAESVFEMLKTWMDTRF
ncbi:MAG: alpha/beta hydrolase [Polaromonas sp.]|nr:alpha/beta hydrolase [Polaromonas sp.]